MTTRKEAIERGLKRYQSGPCRNGHVGDYYVSGSRCAQCEQASRHEEKRARNCAAMGWPTFTVRVHPEHLVVLRKFAALLVHGGSVPTLPVITTLVDAAHAQSAPEWVGTVEHPPTQPRPDIEALRASLLGADMVLPVDNGEPPWREGA